MQVLWVLNVMAKDLLETNKKVQKEVEKMLSECESKGEKEAADGCKRLLKIVDSKVQNLEDMKKGEFSIP